MKRAKQRYDDAPTMSAEDWARFCTQVARGRPLVEQAAKDLEAMAEAWRRLAAPVDRPLRGN